MNMKTASWLPWKRAGDCLAFMKDFQHILFPVDYSAHCLSTLLYVKEMVRSYNARLTLLHVVEIPINSYGSMDIAFAPDSFDKMFKIGQHKLTTFGKKHFDDLAGPSPAATVCDWGDPGYAIVAQAKARGADLIMMPTHGHGAFHDFLLGSTTTRVLHRAECIVWTGAHVEKEYGENESAPHVRIKKILCALDLERESRHVIEAAATLAKKFSAHVSLFHCVPVPESGPTEDFASPFDRFLAHSAREKLMKMQERAGTHFEVVLKGGNISKAVRDTAAHQWNDIIVIGRGHVKDAFSKLRSNAYAIMRDAPCPVLSV